MSNSTLPENLQSRSQARDTGCLLINGSGAVQSVIYLLDGFIVYAEANEHKGLVGIFLPMSWDEVTISWQPRVPAPQILFQANVEELLFQFAQLQDGGLTSEEYLIQNFSAEPIPPAENINLMDMSLYEVGFEVLNGPFKSFVFILDRPEILIGRAEDCDVLLPDGSISSHHCKIFKEERCLRVIDLGSTNGTFVNDTLISDSIIQGGDKFIIGALLISIRLKLKRRLTQPIIIENLEPPKDQRPAFTTGRIDVKALNRKTSKVTGPISWKNLEGIDPKKTAGSGGLFSKMFGKK